MKLLSTIAFLLLTFSAFSQEKLSYQDGIIKQGEEVLSLEELSVLVNGADITYTKGSRKKIYPFKFDAEKTKRQALAGDDKNAARALNQQYLTSVLVFAPTGLIMTTMGTTSIFFGGAMEEHIQVLQGWIMVSGGVAAMYTGFRSYSKRGSSAKFKYIAEKSIYEAVNRYNASLLEAQ